MLGIQSLSLAQRVPTPRARTQAYLVALVYGAFVVASTQRVGLQLVEIAGYLQLVTGVGALVLAVPALSMLRLGLEFPADAAGEGHAESELGGGVRLMLDTIEVVTSFSEWEPACGGHLMGLAFRCESPSTVDETYAEVVSAGYRSSVEPFDAFWGQPYATVLDPDGNPVDLYATL